MLLNYSKYVIAQEEDISETYNFFTKNQKVTLINININTNKLIIKTKIKEQLVIENIKIICINIASKLNEKILTIKSFLTKENPDILC